MSSEGTSPAGAFSAYPHIILAMLVVLAILAINSAAPIYYSVWAIVFIGVLVSKPIRDFVDFFSKCLTPVLLGLLFVMLYFQAYQTQEIFGYNIKEYVGRDATEILSLAQFNPSYQEPFYTAISTLYAIILALALVKGMEDVDELRQSIAEETHRVRSIWNYLKYFEDDELNEKAVRAKARFRVLLLEYLKNIPDGRGNGNAELNRKVMDGCRAAVLEIEPYDRDDQIAQQEIMLSLETIGIMWAKRLGSNSGKISSYLMVALWVMSLALLLPFLAEPLCVDPKVLQEQIGPEGFNAIDKAMCSDGVLMLSPQRFSQYYMIFIIVSFFSFLMLMLHDLSSPDKGFWTVDHSAFDDLHMELSAELKTLGPVSGSVTQIGDVLGQTNLPETQKRRGGNGTDD